MRIRYLLILFLLIATPSYAVNYCADANCQGCWLMEYDGDELDASSAGADLTETGGDIPQDADKVFGTYSRLFAVGDSEWLQMADEGSTDIYGADQELSIVMWVKCGVPGPATTWGLIGKYNSVGLQRGYTLYVHPADTVYFVISPDGTAAVAAIGATDICNDASPAWVHIAAVYNDTDMRIYINGEVDTNGANNPKAHTAGINNSSEPFTLGTYLTLYWDGYIDDVAIFDRALTAEEVTDIYTNGLSPVAASGSVLRNAVLRSAVLQ